MVGMETPSCSQASRSVSSFGRRRGSAIHRLGLPLGYPPGLFFGFSLGNEFLNLQQPTRALQRREIAIPRMGRVERNPLRVAALVTPGRRVETAENAVTGPKVGIMAQDVPDHLARQNNALVVAATTQ